jgi:NAD(P)-dependent dehydrogenase (short-subunit alcohol dehydrogenase family)
MDTNLFGPMNLTRLVLPAMRKRRSGAIVNMSSAAGIEAKASRSQYCASKFALEAFSESLYNEMKPFGVRVLIIEPGAFGSKFAQNVKLPTTELPDEYKGSITEMTVTAVKAMVNTAPPPGDVEKGVQAIFDVIMKTGQAEGLEEFIRLPLGADNAAAWERKLADLRRNLDGTKHIWSNTDRDN